MLIIWNVCNKTKTQLVSCTAEIPTITVEDLLRSMNFRAEIGILPFRNVKQDDMLFIESRVF